MSEIFREELDRYRTQLGEYRRLYQQDATITQPELNHLNALWERVESLQRIDGAKSNANSLANSQTLYAAPAGGSAGTPGSPSNQMPVKSDPAGADELNAEIERRRLPAWVDKAQVKQLSQRVLSLVDETLAKPEWQANIKEQAERREKTIGSMDGMGQLDAEKATAFRLASDYKDQVMNEAWSHVTPRLVNDKGEYGSPEYKATSKAVDDAVKSQLRKKYRRKVSEAVGVNLDVEEGRPGRIMGETEMPLLGHVTFQESTPPPKDLLKSMLALLDKELAKPAVKERIKKEVAESKSSGMSEVKAEKAATMNVWRYISRTVLDNVIDNVNLRSINEAIDEKIRDRFERKEFEPKIKELEKTAPDSRIVRLWKEREQIPQDIREQEEKVKILEKELAGFEQELSRLTNSNAQATDESNRRKIDELKQRIAKTKEWLADTHDLIDRSLPLKEQKLGSDIREEKKKYK